MKINNRRYHLSFAFFLLLAQSACTAQRAGENGQQSAKEEPGSRQEEPVTEKEILTGADRTAVYLPMIGNKRVAVVANQTSTIRGVHLVDSLHTHQIRITKVFALEHGFRGDVQAGEHIRNGKDAKTGIPIVSLYGSNKKPKPEQLTDVDVILFDIQDVGARFYTYISSLHYLMEAAAENGKQVIVLDRPNPNGFYVDGPVLNMKHKSFVGMHPVPIVHGMTVGEYAQMINGEGWLNNKIKCDLVVVNCENYTHDSTYILPVKPSPNLSSQQSIYLYPSLCLFEGTTVSVGRGTDFPFQVIGMPGYTKGDFTFTPRSVQAAKKPPHMDVECRGYDLRDNANDVLKEKKINLHWLLEMYENCPDKNSFFENDGMFTLLSGGTTLRQQIESGKSEEEIRQSWKDGLEQFSRIRSQYLLYPDFN